MYTYESYAQENIHHKRRREVARFVYNLWTEGGMDESGLASPLFDGRVDALSFYSIGTFSFQVDSKRGENSSSSVTTATTVDCVDPSNLSYKEFFHEYMMQNKPLLILRGLMEDWPASSKWIRPHNSKEDNDSKSGDRWKPNIEYLGKQFGHDVVSVHVQTNRGFQGSSFQSRQKIEMTIEEYGHWWDDYSKQPFDETLQKNILYMKDWKFVAEHSDYQAYATPKYFEDDWLNALATSSSSSILTNHRHNSDAMGHAYKFCYVGPAGSITPLHVDVLNSYSWSSNICGSKCWWMIPPQYSYLLYNVYGTRLAPHLHADLDFEDDLGSVLYPGLAIARSHAVTFLQHAGEIVYVPSGWHHTVENIEDTISINHNFINATNLIWSWERVKNEYENELSYCTSRTLERNSMGTKDINQVQGDDFLLLWIIVSKKAKGILELHEIERGDEQSDLGATDEYNLGQILYVLSSMLDLLQNTTRPSSMEELDHLRRGEIMQLKSEIVTFICESKRSVEKHFLSPVVTIIREA